jgi:hypothetical protein
VKNKIASVLIDLINSGNYRLLKSAPGILEPFSPNIGEGKKRKS